jgi:SAM-dependent methyltransferase
MNNRYNTSPKSNTSWQKASDWYGQIVGEKGHYFHQNVIIPRSLKLLSVQPLSSVLDVGCGSGVFARFLPKTVLYVGIDNAPGLIQQAKNLDKNNSHSFVLGDVTVDVRLPKIDFTHAICMLALQNIKDPGSAFRFVARHTRSNARLLIVLNHPCFRIPRQSSWGIDEQNKLEYRRINRYMSPLEIPVTTHPGVNNSPVTWSFHHPLSDYTKYLSEQGFFIEKMEEWISDKVSVGKAAAMENRAREEFPLFLAILARKK